MESPLSMLRGDAGDETLSAVSRREHAWDDRRAALFLADALLDLLLQTDCRDEDEPREDDLFRALHRTFRVVLRRLHIGDPFPFRHLWQWEDIAWVLREERGKTPREQAGDYMEPVYERLDRLDQEALVRPLGDLETGWPEVDARVGELEDRFRHAMTPDDFQAVGLLARDVVIEAALAGFDAARHVPEDCEEPGKDRVGERIEMILAVEAPGGRYEHVRGLVRAALNQANKVQHARGSRKRKGATIVAVPARTRTRQQAAIAGNAAVLCASILRELCTVDDEREEARNVRVVPDPLRFIPTPAVSPPFRGFPSDDDIPF